MMSENQSDAVERITAVLKKKLSEWRQGPDPVLHGALPVFERLITRKGEMAPVWDELAGRRVTGNQLWLLTEQFILAAVEGESGEHAQIRAGYRELQALNEDISETSFRLAQLLERREQILSSGHFHVERMLRLREVIDAAGFHNGHYRSRLMPELDKLNEFGRKYWPDMPGMLHALGEEKTDIRFHHDASEAIALGRPSLRTDFLRNLFDRISELSNGSVYGLRPGFRLSDASLATICNVVLDLPPEKMADAAYLKGARQRLRRQGYSAAW